MSINPLEERIRELCAQALAAKDHDANQIFTELREVLHIHIERTRRMAALDLAVQTQLRALASKEPTS